MQVINHTPFPSVGWPSVDNNDNKYITLLSRVKYQFDALDNEGLWSLKFATDQEALFGADIFYDEKNKEVQFESDFVPYKRQGDLIINLSKNKSEYGHYGVEVLRYSDTQGKQNLLKHMALNKLGVIHRAHKHRLQYVGTADKKWIETHAPKLPQDFNERHYNAASPELQLTQTYFEPGDIIMFHKFLPGQHQQSVMIPGVYIKATVHVGIEEYTTLLETDTIVFDIENLDMNENNIYMSYRHRIPLETKAQKVTFTMMLEDHFIEKKFSQKGLHNGH